MNFKKILASKYPIMLAPLAGISSLPFRIINREFGCKFAFLEMIHARSLCAESRKTMELLRTNKQDSPLGVQLLGSEADFIKQALGKLKVYKYKYDLLDFNAACPQKKITSRGEGAGLLKTPRKLCKLLKVLVDEASVPVSVKIRLGWSDASAATDIAKSAQDAGIDVLFVHGRTKVQGYSGDVDYKTIGKIKKALKIPVIASGNILNAELGKKMFDETGCNGIIVARGALGNPWIFKELSAYLNKKVLLPRPSIDEIADTMKKHFELFKSHFGQMRGVIQFRKFYVWYTRGIIGIKLLRGKVMKIESYAAMIDIIEELRKHSRVS